MPTLECRIPNLVVELRSLLAQIPRGRVTTYGDLADALGSLGAARWVGEYMVDHAHGPECPCHRVVRRTGELGRYIRGGSGAKSRLLQRESVVVSDDCVTLEDHRFTQFQSEKPLERLIEVQNSLPEAVSLRPLPQLPRKVAGLDVSYHTKHVAVAAYALVDTESGELTWSTTCSRAVEFPYIPGFLSFREIPVLLELLEKVDAAGRRSELLFVDGNGLLHHRQAGIAVHVGVLTGIPTIGIGKKLLCGQVSLEGMRADETRDVIYADRVVGKAVRATASSRPIYVSPGQYVTVADAASATQMLFRGHRLPEPIFWADRISRLSAREMPLEGRTPHVTAVW
jgi:deoxyribonuclease V